jgi:molybdate transport repressor ModE-like protein
MSFLRLQPEWILNVGRGQTRALKGVLELLRAVEQEKNLRRACAKLHLSYRHAWGLIQHTSQTLGAPLLHSVRGRGATLTPLGERLVWADKRVAARLSPILDNLASELEAEIRQSVASPTTAVRIHASHSFGMDALRDHLREHKVPLELRYCGSEDALASLCHGTCDFAGFHTPIGELESVVLDRWRKWLRPRTHVLINFVTRRQGILVAPGNPLQIKSLSDLTRPGVRFVNRQHGSGTRLLLDLLLEREGIDPGNIPGFDNVEYTHAAVGAYIASGMGNAGIAVETAARLFHLGFVPLLEERYFLAYHGGAVDSLPVKRVRDMLRGSELKTRLTALPGLSADACGSDLSMIDAYPLLERKHPETLHRSVGAEDKRRMARH